MHQPAAISSCSWFFRGRDKQISLSAHKLFWKEMICLWYSWICKTLQRKKEKERCKNYIYRLLSPSKKGFRYASPSIPTLASCPFLDAWDSHGYSLWPCSSLFLRLQCTPVYNQCSSPLTPPKILFRLCLSCFSFSQNDFQKHLSDTTSLTPFKSRS